MLKPSDIVVRRVSRTLLWALSLGFCFIVAAPANDTFSTLGKAVTGEPDQTVNFFVDITSTRVADEVKMKDKRRVDLAGVPVVIGAARQSGAAAPSVSAGIAGHYEFDLGHHVSVKAGGLVSRAHVIGAEFLSTERAGGDLAFRFEQGGTRVQLRPSLYAAMQDDALVHVDYGLESRFRQKIGGGFDLSAALGRAWHDSVLLDTDDRETGFSRLGLHLDLRGDSDLELAYEFDERDGMLASQYRFTHGPILLAHLAPLPGWRFTGRYGLSATERGYDDNEAAALRHDLHHRLNLESDWDLGSSTGADWHMKAAYCFDQTLTDDPNPLPATHTASVNFALNF